MMGSSWNENSICIPLWAAKHDYQHTWLNTGIQSYTMYTGAMPVSEGCPTRMILNAKCSTTASTDNVSHTYSVIRKYFGCWLEHGQGWTRAGTSRTLECLQWLNCNNLDTSCWLKQQGRRSTTYDPCLAQLVEAPGRTHTIAVYDAKLRDVLAIPSNSIKKLKY